MVARYALGTLILALFFGIVWTISEVYIIGFHLNASGTYTVHSAAVLYVAVFLFSFFSSRFPFARRIKILFKLFNMFTAIVFYLLPTAVVLSIVLAFGTFSLSGATTASTIALITAAALGSIGIIQARIIRTVKHTITLRGAPASWHGRTAVLVSDTHFGLVNHARFARKVVRKIQALNPNFVLHAGDFYDGPAIDLPPVTAPWKALIEKIPTFYTPGNHELYGPYTEFVSSVRDSGATVLLDAVTEYDGVQIAGITYRDRTNIEEAERVIQTLSLDPSKPTILINHPPLFQRAAAAKGIQCMVSGHTHGGQFWPSSYIVWMLYGKYTYGKHQVGSLTALTTRGVGTAGPPCRLFIPPEIVLLEFKTA